MTDLGAWVRRLIGRSPPTSPPDLWLSSTAPPPVLSSEFDRKIDAMIAATETSISRAESLVRLAEDNNAFAAALYGHLRLLGGNQFFSPLSIRTALLMAYFGAKGDTAAQIREALRVSMPDDVLCATCAAMVGALSGAGGAYELAIANSSGARSESLSSRHSWMSSNSTLAAAGTWSTFALGPKLREHR